MWSGGRPGDGMESVAAVWPLQTEDREIEDVRAVQHVQQQARGQRRPRWRRRVARARTDLWLRVSSAFVGTKLLVVACGRVLVIFRGNSLARCSIAAAFSSRHTCIREEKKRAALCVKTEAL